MRLGQEGDHWFCGTKRGGCGARFDLSDLAPELLGAVQVLASLSAGFGFPADRAVRRGWSERLKAGETLDQIRQGIETAGAKALGFIATERLEQERLAAARQWIDANGGPDAIATEAARAQADAWVDNLTAAQALDAWADKRGAPLEVTTLLCREIFLARKAPGVAQEALAGAGTAQAPPGRRARAPGGANTPE